MKLTEMGLIGGRLVPAWLTVGGGLLELGDTGWKPCCLQVFRGETVGLGRRAGLVHPEVARWVLVPARGGWKVVFEIS